MTCVVQLNQFTMTNLQSFLRKLKYVQTQTFIHHHFYVLGHLKWRINLVECMQTDHCYPNEYFVMIINHLIYVNHILINPPIQLPASRFCQMEYITLEYNTLLSLDGLHKQGSRPRYLHEHEYLYSEYAGVILLNDNHALEGFIIITESTRIDQKDAELFMPVNHALFEKHAFLFHTHPKHMQGPRVHDGIVYEAPSVSDIYNFMYYHDRFQCQASLIIAPEGMYVIRSLREPDRCHIPAKHYNRLQSHFMQVEKSALKTFDHDRMLDTHYFHQIIAYQGIYFNEQRNALLHRYNLHIEYYPRVYMNHEWYLKRIFLQYLINSKY